MNIVYVAKLRYATFDPENYARTGGPTLPVCWGNGRVTRLVAFPFGGQSSRGGPRESGRRPAEWPEPCALQRGAAGSTGWVRHDHAFIVRGQDALAVFGLQQVTVFQAGACFQSFSSAVL